MKDHIMKRAQAKKVRPKRTAATTLKETTNITEARDRQSDGSKDAGKAGKGDTSGKAVDMNLKEKPIRIERNPDGPTTVVYPSHTVILSAPVTIFKGYIGPKDLKKNKGEDNNNNKGVKDCPQHGTINLPSSSSSSSTPSSSSSTSSTQTHSLMGAPSPLLSTPTQPSSISLNSKEEPQPQLQASPSPLFTKSPSPSPSPSSTPIPIPAIPDTIEGNFLYTTISRHRTASGEIRTTECLFDIRAGGVRSITQDLNGSAAAVNLGEGISEKNKNKDGKDGGPKGTGGAADASRIAVVDEENQQLGNKMLGYEPMLMGPGGELFKGYWVGPSVVPTPQEAKEDHDGGDDMTERTPTRAKPKWKAEQAEEGKEKDRGKGMFSAGEYKLGSLIHVEKALLVCPKDIEVDLKEVADDAQATPERRELTNDVLTSLYARMQPKARETFSSLCNAYPAEEREKMGICELEGIVKTNGRSLVLRVGGKGKPEKEYLAVFNDLSRINHDCLPNASIYFNTTSFSGELRALKRISRGEEITISYIPSLSTSHTLIRQTLLSTAYNFTCLCKLCTDPYLEVLKQRIVRCGRRTKPIERDLDLDGNHDAPAGLKAAAAEVDSSDHHHWVQAEKKHKLRLIQTFRWVMLIQNHGMQVLSGVYSRNLEAAGDALMGLGREGDACVLGAQRARLEEVSCGDSGGEVERLIKLAEKLPRGRGSGRRGGGK